MLDVVGNPEVRFCDDVGHLDHRSLMMVQYKSVSQV